MKKIKFLYIVGVLLSMVSCKKFLDINENPNSPTEMTPELILPSALTRSASMMVSYNSYGAWMAGYAANAGGFGGWGSALTYEYLNTSYTGIWETTYDILSDYQQLINLTEGDDRYAYFNGVAKIMQAFHFQYLVDTYNDVPYTDALLDVRNVSPTYDKAQDVYLAIADLIDNGIATIKNAVEPKWLSSNLGQPDVFFRANAATVGMVRWIQFANTIKLRLYVRASETNIFPSQLTLNNTDGFITQDVTANPGYGKVPGQQSPFWDAYHSSATNAGASRSWITTYYVMSFYNGTFIDDIGRATAVYRGGIAPNRNQLGVIDNPPAAPAGSSVWFSGNSTAANGFSFGQNSDNTVGVLKGPSQPSPVFTLAEAYLLQAEAAERGIIPGDVKALFDRGIEESFIYLFKTQAGDYKTNVVIQGLFGGAGGAVNATTVRQLATRYKTEGGNASKYLVNIDLATTQEQRIEAIITQKYVALNMIAGFEAWAEYRRTGYPRISGTAAATTFVSILSAATTPDRTLGRVLYPASEYQLNASNVPQGISVFGSYVFWDFRN